MVSHIGFLFLVTFIRFFLNKEVFVLKEDTESKSVKEIMDVAEVGQWVQSGGNRKHSPEVLCSRNICQSVQGMIRGEKGTQNCMHTLIATMLKRVVHLGAPGWLS